MRNFSSSRIRSQIRRAQRQIRQAQRKLEYELRHPVVQIKCTCGYWSKARRSSIPRCCPRCGTPINFQVG